MKTTPATFALWLGSIGLSFGIGVYIAGQGAERDAGATLTPAEKTELVQLRQQLEQQSAETGIETDQVVRVETSKDDSDPAATVRAYFTGERDSNAFALAIAQLSAEASAVLLEEALLIPDSDPQKSRILESLFRQLALTQPVYALEMASSIGSLRTQRAVNRAILESWGSRDPIGAIQYVNAQESLHTQRDHAQQMSAAIRGYASLNPAAAIDFVTGLQVEDRRDSRFQSYLMDEILQVQIEAGNLDGMRVAVEGLPEGELRERAMTDLIDEWADYDPSAAAQYVSTLGDAVSPSVKARLVEEWASHDPKAAADWLTGLGPEDPAYREATSELIQEWARYDLTASGEWLNSQAPSEDLDRAVMSYTFNAAREDPEAAIQWAGVINNEQMSERITERITSIYAQSDPEGFQEYAKRTNLTEEQIKSAQEGGGFRGSWRGRGND